MKSFVYALIDPRDGSTRYVGKSDTPVKRLESHISKSAANGVRSWILDIGEKPELRILEECMDPVAAIAAEAKWIKSMRAAGADLLNRHWREPDRTGRSQKFPGFAERLLAERGRIGIGQRELGKRAGISTGCISRIERSKRPFVTAETAVLLARALGRSVEWLVTGEEPASAGRAA